jgi:hypothetical protein
VCSRVRSTADGRDIERQWTVDWALLLPSYLWYYV